MQFFLEPADNFVLVIATVKTRHVLKRAWQGLSAEICPNWKRSVGHDQKIMFIGHDLKTGVFHHDPVIFSNLDIFPLEALACLYGCSRQCGRPVGAPCSMGLGRNPLINGLIQHTFKFNFLLVEKIHINTF